MVFVLKARRLGDRKTAKIVKSYGSLTQLSLGVMRQDRMVMERGLIEDVLSEKNKRRGGRSEKDFKYWRLHGQTRRVKQSLIDPHITVYCYDREFHPLGVTRRLRNIL